MILSLRTSVLCTLAALVASFSTHVSAEQFPLPTAPHIIVIGEGKVEEIPDVVNLVVDASQTASNFAEAKKQVDYVVGKVIIAAKELGVLMDDINAAKINAVPQYEWQDRQRVYKGEQVSRMVAITLRAPERYNELVDALLMAGINRLSSVQLDFSNKKELEGKAMKLALDDANEQASVIARHLRTKLKSPYQIAPMSAQHGPRQFEMVAKANMSAPEPQGELKLGKQAIVQNVRVVYLLNE